MTPFTPLDFLTHALRHDQAAGHALKASLQCGPVDWRRVVRLASGHYVLPTLTSGLQRHGVLDELPPEVAEALEAARYLNRERNQILRTALIDISRALNLLGLEPLLLKGALALLPGQYPDAEDRMVGDLDIWIPPARHAEATAALVEIGYRSAQESWQWVLPQDRRAMHHDIPLLHRELPIKIELHRRVLHNPADDQRLTQWLRPKAVSLSGGAVVRVPDTLSRIRHNFLHAQVTDRQAIQRQLNLRQLLEFTRLAESLDPVEPTELLAGLRQNRYPLFYEYWAQAERWLGLDYPDDWPRSPRQNRELWLTQRVAESRRWSRSLRAYSESLRLPRRLLRLGLRVFHNPAYFEARIKRCLQR